MNSPFMEPFIDNDIPVMFLTINIEEMILKQINEYKGFKFINIESPES